MADITIEGTLHDEAPAKAATDWLVETADGVMYAFIVTGTRDLQYRKSSDGGATWAAAVTIESADDVQSFGIWWDGWTPNVASPTYIRIAWLEGSDDIMYRTLDVSSDTLGTQRTLTTYVANYDVDEIEDAFIQPFRAEGGQVYVYWQQGGGSTPSSGFYRTTNSGSSTSATSFTSRGSPFEAQADYLYLCHANTGDTNDIACVYWDDSASQITVKIYDDSANTWAEATVVSSVTLDVGTGIGYWPIKAVARHSDEHVIMVARVNAPTAAGDGICYDLTIESTSAITATAKTVFLSSVDEWGSPDVFIDQNSDALYVGYLRGASAIGTCSAFYKRSTDGGGTWGSESSYSEGAAAGLFALTSTKMVPDGSDGHFQLGWINDAAVDALTNVVNAVEITAGGGGVTVEPGVASLTTTRFAPTVAATANQTVTPSVLALVTSLFAPTVLTPRTVTPGLLSLTTSLFAPTVTPTLNQFARPGIAELVTEGFAPTVTPTLNQFARPGIAELATEGFAPSVTATANQLVTPDQLALALTAFEPSVSGGGNVSVTPGVLALVTSLLAPTVLTPRTVVPDALALTLTAFAPNVLAPRVVIPGALALTLTAFAASVQTPRVVVPGAAALVLTAFAPLILLPRVVTPGVAALTLTAFVPVVSNGEVILVPGTVVVFDKPAGSVLVQDWAPEAAVRDALAGHLLVGDGP